MKSKEPTGACLTPRGAKMKYIPLWRVRSGKGKWGSEKREGGGGEGPFIEARELIRDGQGKGGKR